MKNEVFGEIGNQRYLDYAKDINASGTHLLAIINDILDVAKLDAGEFSITLVDVDLRSLLRECEVMVTDRLSRAGLALRMACAALAWTRASWNVRSTSSLTP